VTSVERRCGTCRHFVKGDTDGGHCTRYAPHPRLAVSEGEEEEFWAPKLMWPLVESGDRCGEWVVGGAGVFGGN